MSVLQLEDVSKFYAGSSIVAALRSVSVRIDAGELVAVVGPSGSGKSTMLSIAGTLEQPSSGQVRIGGRAVGHLGDDELSAVRAFRIGFVFQQFFLLPTRSALENVADGLLYRGIAPEARRQRALVALEGVGLAHRGGHRPGELSGGEAQRVAIARAIVGGPSIIFADEPTGNLDTRQGLEIVDLLSELNSGGSTIVVVTHNEDVAGLLPRRIGLRDGSIEFDTRGDG